MHRGIAAFVFLAAVVYAQDQPSLKLSARIGVPNVNGRIDHLSADLKGHRLFVSALGNHTVEVLDVQKGTRLHTIPNLAEPQGVYYDASTNRLFVACANDGTASVFDGSTFHLLKTVRFSGDADNIRYDARAQHILVGYGEGALGLLDATGQRVGDIPLDAHPESFQLERTGTRAFVNVPDRNQIEVIDLAKNAVVSRWRVNSAANNFPMALDETHHRLLIGCRAPARMLVFETGGGKQTAAVDIVGDTDDLFYDASASRVYVIGGQGFIDVFKQGEADRYQRLNRVATAPGARTGLYVPDWGKLFVAVPHRGEQRAEILVYDTR